MLLAAPGATLGEAQLVEEEEASIQGSGAGALLVNHKRGKPKSARAGCMLCKPHKHQGAKKSEKNQPIQERRAIEAERLRAKGQG